jgi:two-component sensor histidine kinase
VCQTVQVPMRWCRARPHFSIKRRGLGGGHSVPVEPGSLFQSSLLSGIRLTTFAVLLRWLTRVRRWRQPPLVRWVEAVALFGIALTVRLLVGRLYGVMPALSFYPAVVIAAMFVGWQQAVFIMVIGIIIAWIFFVPPDQMLLPVMWGVVGAVNVTIIILLKTLAERLAEANERQRLLFQELQHRVANTLQSTVATLERIKRTTASNPAESANLLNQAIQRMFVSAEMHHRLHDPTLFYSGLEPILREVVATVIDKEMIIVNWKIEKIDLSLDQMSVLAMLVMEIANNSAKHVFQRDLGSQFEVELSALPGRRVMLKVSDDGPGIDDGDEKHPAEPGISLAVQGLGTQILEGLADQIDGTLTIAHDHGTTVRVEFPTVSGRKGTASHLRGPRDVGYGLS